MLSDAACARFKDAYYSGCLDGIDVLIPEVGQCFKQTQNSKWHIYNVMEHILHSVEEMDLMTTEMPYREREIAAYTMFFHDMGKPECRSVVELNGVERESFRQHNIASERIAARVLPALGFDEGTAAIIKTLVREHDIFLLFSDLPQHEWQIKPTSDFFKGMVKELDAYGDGKKLLDLLFLVGIADNRAQNPSMTSQPLKYIEKLRSVAKHEI